MLLMPKKNRKKGFTLIELIVVVAILAILAAIAVPSFIGLTDKAKKGVDIANASAIAGVINTYNAMQPDKSTWYTTNPPTWAGLTGVAGIKSMLPVISGGTGADAAAWQANACAIVAVDSATGVATVETAQLQS